MNKLRPYLYTAAASWTLLAGGLALAGASAPALADDYRDPQLSPATLRQLAQVRAATAKYHDINRALADGYLRDGPDLPGEGIHFVNPSLIDCNFDPAHPEILHYTVLPDEDKDELQLVGVEFGIPLAGCLPPNVPPEGFKGNADQWAQEDPDHPLWLLNVWIWLRNPDGIFTSYNPRISGNF
jgi:hypothetical protein